MSQVCNWCDHSASAYQDPDVSSPVEAGGGQLAVGAHIRLVGLSQADGHMAQRLSQRGIPPEAHFNGLEGFITGGDRPDQSGFLSTSKAPNVWPGRASRAFLLVSAAIHAVSECELTDMSVLFDLVCANSMSCLLLCVEAMGARVPTCHEESSSV